MLAQNLKTPADLGIKDAEFDALLKVLGMLEREEIPYAPRGMNINQLGRGQQPLAFQMYHFRSETECGTACCLCGWAEYIGKLPHDSLVMKRFDLPNLHALFDPPHVGVRYHIENILPAQAALALRSYLTTGEPCWNEALGIDD